MMLPSVSLNQAALAPPSVTISPSCLPGKHENEIVTEGGAKAAWFKDTEGNIMAVIQSL